MRKILLTTAAAALALGTLASTAGGAEARPGYRDNGRAHYAGRRGNRAGAAVAVGVAGALIGGAIAANASRQHGYYDQPYGGGYGAPAYGPGPGSYYDY